jgi:hypothetical protein
MLSGSVSILPKAHFATSFDFQVAPGNPPIPASQQEAAHVLHLL